MNARLAALLSLPAMLVAVACASGTPTPVATTAPQQPATQPAPATRPQAQPPAPASATASATSATSVADSVKPGRFDTGRMWTFENAPLSYFQEAYGFTPTEAWLKRARLSALRLPNCTASFVSPNGLVMSNHHCAREASDEVTKPGEDLLNNGFYAAKQEDERKAGPDVYVDQMVEIRDVTQEIASLPATGSEEEQIEARDEKIAEIEGRVSAETKLKCEATSLYHGGKYSLYCYKRYTDIRLVFEPEVSVAFFGGDPDNFTYPRYDLDVSFFRVYENGQPLKTENFLPWSPAGAKEGDPVFVIGNPGSTSRLETVAQLEYKRDVQFPSTISMLDSRARVMEAYMKAHPEKKAGIITDYFGITNSLKAYRGELEGLHTPALFNRKLAFERDFKKTISAKPELAAKYGSLWTEIADLRSQIRRIAPTLNSLQQGGLTRSKTLAVAFGMVQIGGAVGRVPDSIIKQFANELLTEKIDPELDAMVLAAQLEDARKMLGAEDTWVSRTLAGRTPIEAARGIIAGSGIPDSAKRAAMLANPASLNSSTDLAIQVVRPALPRFQQAAQQYQQLTAQEEIRTSKLARALFDAYGTSIAPDATFTLRIADGTVQGYNYNGTRAPWFTTFYGMYDRHYSNPGNADWALPKRWLSPPAAFDLKTPLNMVTTNDIIGGNSGSPMIDRQGRVVGLIFDGNIESLPGSFIYDTESNRAVSVHSQAILAALRDLYGAKRIADELAATIAR